MTVFFIKFILTNVLFSVVIGLVLVRFNRETGKGEKIPNLELMLYSLGMGPVFTVLILYFLLLLLPGYPDLFYLGFVVAVYILLLVWGWKSIRLLVKEASEFLASRRSMFRSFSRARKTGWVLYLLLVTLSVTVFFVLYLGSSLHVPIDQHDTLVYGNIGKVYYAEKAITYSRNIFDEENGFAFIGSPKPSFSLLLTWEMILNRALGHRWEDLYFRSISAYFGFLILCVMFYWLSRKNRYLALLGVLVLLSGFRFYLVLVTNHLDSYRMFFLFLSWIFLAYTVKGKDRFSLFLLGVFSGFAAFTHVIGVAAAIVNGLALLIFYESGVKTRVLKTAALGLLVLLFGGLHYLLEALYGAKWGFLTYFK